MGDGKYYFYSSVAKQALAAMDQKKEAVDISVDLNKSTKTFSMSKNELILDSINKLNRHQLLYLSKKENKIFVLKDNELKTLEFRHGYYKLVPTERAPTVEINGVKMHRSKGINPFADAEQKAKEVIKKGHRVLDTCGGLGYTAIWALRKGAREVLSVEYDESILKLREQNPWSKDLYNKRIKLVNADISRFIEDLESESFDSILHDPPRLSLAGELYGEKFYAELYRVLVKGGGLFHYTGNPHLVRRGNAFLVNVARRLKSVGFRKVLLREYLLGVKVIK